MRLKENIYYLLESTEIVKENVFKLHPQHFLNPGVNNPRHPGHTLPRINYQGDFKIIGNITKWSETIQTIIEARTMNVPHPGMQKLRIQEGKLGQRKKCY